MIVGLVGKAETGKSTLANFLVEELNFREFAFASSLKKHAKKYLKIDPLDKIKNRNILQGFGQFVRDEIDKDFWIKKLHEEAVYFLEDNIVISDVRYVNESKYIKDNGGILLRIERDVPTMLHPSETEQDEIDCDFVIKNNGSLHDFHYRFSDWIYNLKKEGVIEWERKL